MKTVNDKLRNISSDFEVYVSDYTDGKEELDFVNIMSGDVFTISVKELAIVSKFLKLTEEI